ncbi:TonB family protein [Qipengyuania zhejiangensis]|uniref:TonB family protein n=1 Tax=Qipengyuania zhejiangensis TaxID=3077782 RepID=UPI002D78D0BE|nr:TonB family protein [Qipengyuania sp. Z2]
MNKLTILALSAAATASIIAVPLASQEIVVSPRGTTTFVQEVSNDLNQQLERIPMGPRFDSHGIVKIRFRSSEDGRPVDISTYQSSGRNQLDAAARRAVRGLTSLAPLPRGANGANVIQANIIVAQSERQMENYTRRLAREEAARIASSPEERAVLALTLGADPVS